MPESNYQPPRFPPPTVRLGPLTQQLLSGAIWQGKDAFPAWQDWADDVEEVLSFLDREGRLKSFLSIAKSVQTPQHRDACLGEARAAYHLYRNGFQIIQWEPPGEGDTRGDVLVSLANSPHVFVEIKQPGWQGEFLPRRVSERRSLSPDDQARRLARMKQDKYMGIEGGAVGSHLVALDVVRRNALPKLTDQRPNLVVVIDDLKVTPVGLPGLSHFAEREFLNPDHDPDDPEDVFTYERLGGVLFLQPEAQLGQKVCYLADFVLNGNVIPPCVLPPNVILTLLRMREETQRLRERQFAGRPTLIEVLRSRGDSGAKPW